MLNPKREHFMNFREKLRSHDPVFGLVMQGTMTSWAEIIALTGFDFVWIDMEHTAMTFSEVEHLIITLENYGCVPLVRVRRNEANCTGQVLDMGARIVNIPHVDTVEDALEAVRNARYFPLGRRGYSTCSRSTLQGKQRLDTSLMAEKNDETMLMVQIESGEAVRNVDDIAAVEGVDILFIGSSDLSQDMGITPDPRHPKLEEAVHTVSRAIKQHGKIGAFIVPDPSRVPYYCDLGFNLIICGMDTAMFRSAAETLLARFKPGDKA
ncbi:hypothetical protein LLG96_18300 [bacterium]|nr:hypothetical protein [bacterium]